MTTFHRLRNYITNNKFKIYFCFLLANIITDPLPTPTIIDKSLFMVLILGFCFSPYFMTLRLREFILSVAMFCSFIINKLLNVYGYAESLGGIIVSVTVVVLYFAIIIELLWYTVRQEVISNDLIFSGLTGFFLIGLGFAFVFGVIEDMGYASYITNSGTVKAIGDGNLIYFSLSNLSTLGVGDITPNTVFLKRLTVLESCIGTLFVAVFIGRLIGLTAENQHRRKNEIRTLK